MACLKPILLLFVASVKNANIPWNSELCYANTFDVITFFFVSTFLSQLFCNFAFRKNINVYKIWL